MSDFVPPYPKRHAKDLNPLQALYYARKDLLSIWSENDFKQEFMGQKVLKQHVFIANSPDTIKHVFVTKHDIYERKSTQMRRALEPLLGDGLFVSDGCTWKSRRKIQTPLFDSTHIKQFSKVMVSTITEMADNWSQLKMEKEINVHPQMGQLAAEIIARTLFGEKLGAENSVAVVNAFADYQSVIKQMALYRFFGLPEWFPNLNAKTGKAKAAAKTIHRIVDDIIDTAEKENHQGTLVAQLIEANKNPKKGLDSMTKEQIRNEIIVLFMAGHETTANVLSWAWYLIGSAPEVEKKLHSELDTVLGGRVPEFEDVNKLEYTRAILDETMRLYPPVPILSRQATGDDVIRGKKIPKGSLILIIPWLIQRHKKFWDKPDHFIPERFLPGAKKPEKFSYIPFSAGPRVCLGKSFGITESVLVIAILAQRFKLRMPENAGYVEHECRLTLRPKGHLPMIITAR